MNTRQRFHPAAARLVAAMILILLPMLRLEAQTGNFPPLGYWRFENPNKWLDQSGQGHNVTLNALQLTQGNTPPLLAGSYHKALDWAPTAGVPGTMDDNARRISISMELWIRVRQGLWQGSMNWINKAQLSFADKLISFDVATSSGLVNLTADLLGVNTADPYHLLDGGWHHVVAVYSAKTGEQRIYVDGVCPPGFFTFHGNGAPINDGGVLNFTYNGGVDRLVADIDEVAVYDTIIPAQLVWEHYQQGLAHQAYNFQQQSAVATYPFPPPVQESERNILEFAPGYPNVPLTPLKLFGTYPLPRYQPGSGVRRLEPWMTDVDPFYSGAPLAQSNFEASVIMDRLAHEWNYYLYAGGVLGNYSYVRNGVANPNSYIYHMMQSLNSPSNAFFPRFMVSNWGGASQMVLHNDTNYRRAPYIALQKQLPPSQINPLHDGFFICDSSLATATQPRGPVLFINSSNRKNYAMCENPGDPRLDSIRFDGQLQAHFIDTFLRRLNLHYMNRIGENDEQVGVLDYSSVFRDAEIGRDYHLNFASQSMDAYQGARGTQFREAYQTPWEDSVNVLNSSLGVDSLETYWYNLAGKPDAYAYERDILRYRDHKGRGAPYFYPNNPYWWRHGNRHLTGMDNICISTYYQQLAGDSMQIPSVSPGFNDGDQYAIHDTEMERPGQFLGQLKAMASMGAESYVIFMLNVNVGTNQSQGNWRTWQMPMLSYAQAITSRVQRFMHQGHVLKGDITNAYAGPLATYYTFSTGNNNDLITGRQLYNQYVYLISASAQRTANDQSQGPKSKLVSFRFHDDNNAAVFNPLVIEERLQGSTYVLDRSNPAAPVFYQLDKWHEWKEPAHWCRDFDFEAEVWDSTVGPATRFTERPVPASSGDFSQFTTFITHPNAGAFTQYHFRPTGADQDTLYLWVRARSHNGQQGHVYARVDGGPAQDVLVPAGGPGWGWHGNSPAGALIAFSPLDTTEHVLEIATSSMQVQLDRVLLLRTNTVNTPNWIVSADIVQWTDTICLGDTASFIAKVGASPGCFDYTWDFGDHTHSSGGTATSIAPGWSSSVDSVNHMYQYPGDYRVILTTTSTIEGQVSSDTVWVHVGAPDVDAGNDTVVCAGGHVQLAGAQAQPQFHWESPAPGQLSDTTILNPVATANASQYFYLTATDAQGCSMTDSVWFTAIGIGPVRDTVWICPGDTARLNVPGAYTCSWSPSTGLTSPNIANPIATPAQTTTYYCHATDICGCFNLYDSTVVVVRGILENDTTICRGTPLMLHATGHGAHMWHWTPDSSAADSVVANSYGSDLYTITFDSTAGCYTDQVHVTVLPYACCDVPGAPSMLRPHAVGWTLPTTGGSYHIVDTFFVDANISFTNTTFWMDSMAVIYVLPGETLTTTGCTFQNACPWMWEGIKLQGGSSRLVSTQDRFYNAERAVWSRLGAPFVITGSRFFGCWVGIYVGTLGAQAPAGHPGRIEGCYFGPSQLLPPYNNQAFGWAGVHLDNVDGFTLGVPAPSGQMNRFEKLQHGLYASKSSATVYNNYFGYMQRGTVAPSPVLGVGIGAGVRWIAPNGQGNASYGATVGHPTALSAQVLANHANTFTNCPLGVHAQGYGNIKVRGNILSLNRTGILTRNQSLNNLVWIDYNQHSNDSLAIQLNTETNISGHVEENLITGTSPLVTSLHHGIRCDAVGFTQVLPASSYPFRIHKNTLKLRGNGIWVNLGSRINISENLITLLPTSNLDHFRGINIVSSPKNHVNLNRLASNALGSTLARVEGIHVFSSKETGVTCNSTKLFGQHVVFEAACSLSVFKGDTMTTGLSGLVYLQGGFIGQQGSPISPSDNRWFGTFSIGHTNATNSFGMQSQLAVRNGISYVPTVNAIFGVGNPMTPINNATGSSFLCPAAFIAAGKVAALVDLSNSTTGLAAMDSAMKYRDLEWAYEEILADSSLPLAAIEISDLKDSLEFTSIGATSRAKAALEVPDTIVAVQEVTLLAANNAVESNYESVYDISTNDDQLDSLEIAQLLLIANQCEELGGRGVNLARAMLAGEGIYFWDDPDCDTIRKVVKKTAGSDTAGSMVQSVQSHCWPNPTSGLLYIDLGRSPMGMRLTVHGSHGETLVDQDVDYASQPISLDTRAWAQGLVMVSVAIDGGPRLTWKVLLQR